MLISHLWFIIYIYITLTVLVDKITNHTHGIHSSLKPYLNILNTAMTITEPLGFLLRTDTNLLLWTDTNIWRVHHRKLNQDELNGVHQKPKGEPTAVHEGKQCLLLIWQPPHYAYSQVAIKLTTQIRQEPSNKQLAAKKNWTSLYAKS